MQLFPLSPGPAVRLIGSPSLLIPLAYSGDLCQDALEGGQTGLCTWAFIKVIGDAQQVQG